MMQDAGSRWDDLHGDEDELKAARDEIDEERYMLMADEENDDCGAV